ncbi:hypothetical protein IWW50_007103, partial [Coemansia erecta]
RHKSRKDARSSDSEASEHQAANTGESDAPLGKKFVWKKKVEQDRAKGLSRAERAAAERARREEAAHELDRLRQRREQREIEHAQREQELARARREQEQEKLGDWERREEEFHLGQAKRRAEIRIKGGRARPVDGLAMNLRLANEALGDEEAAALGMVCADVDEPHRMVECLGARDARELAEDVEMYLALESVARNVEFWENMLVVVNAHLDQLDGGGGVRSEVRGILDGKSLAELAELETDVQAKLAGEQGAVDVDYWEHVREDLGVEKAKATLAEMHADILERRLQRLRQARDGPSSDAGAAAAGSGAGGAGPARGSSAVEQRKRQRLEELQRRILE